MKNKLILIVIILTISIPLFAQEQEKIIVPREKNVFVNPSDNEFLWKVGPSYALGPSRFGLDVSFNYMYNLDPVFVFGFEGDLFWITRAKKLGEADNFPGAESKDKTDLYAIPLFFNSQVRLPFLRNKIYVERAFTVGLGYAFMLYRRPGVTHLYTGLALQGFASVYYKIFDGSAVDFVLDIGYRRLPLSRKGIEIDMSGFITRVGVRIFI